MDYRPNADPSKPPQPVATEAERIAFAAGLFEGEGCIYQHGTCRISLTISSTDEDVMVRFQRIIGVGRLTHKTSRDPRRKDTWRVDINKHDDVLHVLHLFLPFLGTRRRAKARELLAVLDEHVEEVTRERVCPQCQEAFRPTFGQGVTKRKIYCSIKCQQTAAKRRLYDRHGERYERERQQRAADARTEQDPS